MRKEPICFSSDGSRSELLSLEPQLPYLSNEISKAKKNMNLAVTVRLTQDRTYIAWFAQHKASGRTHWPFLLP